MSETAERFTGKKPGISASVEISEHFEAMDAERADFMAMLADLEHYSFMDEAYENSLLSDFYDDLDLGLNESFQPSANTLFLDMCYDEEAERERQENEAYDRRCEDAYADRYEY